MGVPLLLPRLRPDQYDIATHPAKVKCICSGRRWGKTVMAGAIALSAAAQGGKVAWIVPHYKNARPIWRWAESVTAPLARRQLATVNKSERTIDFAPPGRGKNPGYLGVYTADNDSSIRGDWFNLAILEEAAQLQETTWTDVVQPTLADADGDALLISTPRGKNWYWREFMRAASRQDGELAAFTAPSSANPNPRIQRASLLAKSRVPAATYRQEWLAEFISGAVNPYQPDFWQATADHDSRRFDATDEHHTNACVGRWISWDTAFKDTADAAYTAAVVGELMPDYRLFIRHVWRDKVTFPTLVDRIERMTTEWNADRKLQHVLIEDKASGISAYQTLTETRPELRGVVKALPVVGSKEARADLAAVYAADGDVWLPQPSEAVPWLQELESELYAFPDAAMPRDQVDALGQLVLHLSLYLQQGREAREAAALLDAETG